MKFFWKFYLTVLSYVSGLAKYDPMRAPSDLPLPKELKAKQRCLDIRNNDEKFIIRSILGSLHPLQYVEIFRTEFQNIKNMNVN